MKRKTRLNASPADNSAKLQKHVDATDTVVSPETTAPMEAEKSTHRREGFFRSLVENSLDGMMVLNLEGIIQFVNSACAEIVGSEPEDMIGKSVFPLIHPDDVQKATKIRENLIRNLGAREYSTIRMLHRDGSWRIVESMGTSILDESRKLVTLSTLRDITARRRAEETLAESEGLFRRLSESVFDGIVIHEEGRILEINPAMLDMFGYQRAETIGRLIWEFVTQESAQVIQNSVRQGRTKPYEITGIRKDGSTFPVEGVGRDCRYQGRAARVIALRDITERKQAEEALRESEERFRDLTQAAFEGFAVHENDRIVEVSPAMAKILGRELSEIVGHSGMEFVTPESAQVMQRNMASGYENLYEITVVRNDGSTVPAEILGKSCLYEGRKARIVAYRDLTEQKRMAEALRESQERMRAVLENSPDLITSVDANGNIVFANRMFRQYREEEVIGSSIYRYTRPINQDLVRDSLAQVFASGTPARFEIAGPGEGDRTSWYEVRVGPIRQDGRIVNAVVIATDITERRRMQDALAESEERFRAIATTARDAIVLADGEGNISYWNPAAEEMLGYTSVEAVGKSFSFLLSEELRATHEEGYRSFARTGQGDRIGKVTEFPHFIRRDGSLISAEISVSAIEIEGRWHALGIMRDITQRKQMERELTEYREQLERLVAERTSELARANELLRQEVSQHKRTEQALRASETKFRELTELLPQTVFEIDLAGNLTFANRCGLESFGYTQQDLAKGINDLQLFIPEDSNRISENTRKRLKGELVDSVEYTALRKNGSTFPALVHASPIVHEGKPVGFRGIVVDITERKRAEEAVRKNEHELRALLEATHDAACLMDSQGNLITLNENFASGFGRHVDELVGTNIFDLLPPELAECRRQRADEAISSRQSVYAEDERDGKILHSSYCPIFDDKGDLIRFAVFARDITEQRQAEERIRQLQRQQMETEKLAATGRMAARIAHEINNPLGGIKNSFELIKDAIPKEHRHYDYVGRIEKEIERITRIVRQMIDLHRPYIALSRPFRVDKTIQDIIALLEHNLRGNSVILQTHAEDARVTVTMSEDSLRQVVNNLIQNAIEASPEGGIVRIRAEVTGKTLVITVRDQGSGIPEDARLQVYEPFYTTKSSRLTGGLGLGLSIAKNLVEAMGGSLDFESIIGQGTTFTIILPIETSQKEARNG